MSAVQTPAERFKKALAEAKALGLVDDRLPADIRALYGLQPGAGMSKEQALEMAVSLEEMAQERRAIEACEREEAAR